MAALPAGVVYLLLWFVPPVFDDSESYWKFIYYLLFYFAFQALLTVSGCQYSVCVHVHAQLTLCSSTAIYYSYRLILFFCYYSVFMFPSHLSPCICHMTIKKEILQHYSVGFMLTMGHWQAIPR